MCSAVSYLLRPVDETTIDADVSIKNHAGMRRWASYSLTWYFDVRAVTRQSIDLTGVAVQVLPRLHVVDARAEKARAVEAVGQVVGELPDRDDELDARQTARPCRQPARQRRLALPRCSRGPCPASGSFGDFGEDLLQDLLAV